MSFKKLLAVVMASAVACGAFAVSAVELDAAESANEAVVAEEAVLAAGTDVWDGSVDTSWYVAGETSYTVDTAAEFAGLAKLVNEGTESFAGKTVVLGADVDLDPVDWTSIGTASNPFLGTFDGNGKTISNLWCGGQNGLFGYTSSGNRAENYGYEAIIKNFTLDSVFVGDGEQKHNGAGAVVGCGNMYTTISNVTVKGDVVIVGARAGGILGYAYSGARIDNCHVDSAYEGGVGVINALYWACGGIMGFGGPDGDVVITNCTVKNININAVNHYGAGGILGNGGSGKVENVAVENVACSVAYGEDAVYYISGGPTATGDVYVAGVSAKVNDVEVEVTGEDLTNVKNAVASVNGEYYETLQAAIDAAANGDTVVVLADITAEINPTADSTSNDYNALIHTDKNDVITLDLNGKTLSAKGSDEAKYDTLAIRNHGDLTIVDSSADKTGKVTLSFDGTNEVGSSQIHSTILNFGTLTIKGGTIENTATKGYGVNAIYNYSWGGNAVLTIDDAVVTTNMGWGVFQAIYDDFSKNNNFVTINGGTITGGVYMWYQGACLDSALAINGGTINAGNSAYAVRLRTSGDYALEAAISENAVINGEVYVQAKAKIGDTYFATLEAAVTAANDGDVIDLLGNTFELTSVNETKKMHTKNLTFQNGTMDFTNAVAGNSLFDMRANQSIKFKDMTLLIKDRAEGSAMCYWMDLCSPTAVAYFENCFIDFDAVQYSYISANGDGKVFFTNCTIEAEQANFVYRAGATFENCTFDGYAGLSEGESAANIILWAAVPCTIKNSTVYTRNIGSISANGTIDIVDGSFVQAERVRHFYSSGNANYTPGLVTVDATSTLEAKELDMELINEASEGTITTEASSIYVQYKKVDLDENGKDNIEDEDKYEIVLVGANNALTTEIINELASADLTFNFVGTPVNGGEMAYYVEAADGVTLTKLGDRYMFNYNGSDKYEETGAEIVIGTITVSGYGAYTLGTADVTTNAVYATEIKDNIVDGYTPAAGLVIKDDLFSDDELVGEITTGNIAVPVRTLTVNVTFPNEVAGNAVAYQDMKVEITGNIDGVQQTVTYDLGEDMTNGAYVVTEERLVLNEKYNVVVSGAGYRTARYAVTMTGDKEINFWNNVKDNETAVEEGKYSEKKNFLAGDIVADNKINIYDLSAVVSYFATETDTSAYSEYAKYDLNRDGKIDSKDVAYVLVSWGE